MRSYLIFREKARRFREDREIQQLLAQLGRRGGRSGPLAWSPARARALKEKAFDLAAMREEGYAYERLDQLTMELLLGVR